MTGNKALLVGCAACSGKTKMDFMYLKDRRGNGWVTNSLKQGVKFVQIGFTVYISVFFSRSVLLCLIQFLQ